MTPPCTVPPPYTWATHGVEHVLLLRGAAQLLVLQQGAGWRVLSTAGQVLCVYATQDQLPLVLEAALVDPHAHPPVAVPAVQPAEDTTDSPTDGRRLHRPGGVS